MSASRQPKPLQKGDTIAIAAPAGLPHDMTDFHKGVTLLQEMGFCVRFPRDGWQQAEFPWLAGKAEQRAEELNRLWADPEVAAIIALRGGFGSLQILELLNWRLIAENPKLLVGFSDITALLNVISARTGQLTLHGPVTTSLANTSPAALYWLQHCLSCGMEFHLLPPIKSQNLEVLVDGESVSAPLVGGNLATLITLLATPFDIDYAGKILLLEDIGEPLYKIDRMLSQLRIAGKLGRVKGILLGDFHTEKESSIYDPLAHLRYLEQIWKLVLTHCQKAGSRVPIWANIPTGHCTDNFTLPIGATITMDREKKALFFQPEEKA